MFCRRRTNICLILLYFCYIMTGCASDSYISTYDVGVVQTCEYEKNSKICCFNKEFQMINSYRYPYSYIDYVDFSNACIYQNNLYMAPQGDSFQRNFGKIVALDLESGQTEEFDFNRINITGYDCNEKFVCATSNLNNINYLDVYDRDKNKIISAEYQDIYVNTVAIVNDEIYGVTSITVSDQEKLYICKFDFENSDYKKIYEIKRQEEFLEKYDENLYFLDGNNLCEYDTATEEIKKIQLSKTDGFNINVFDDKIYVGFTDIFNGSESFIDIISLKTKQVVGTIKHNGCIRQMEISKDGSVYVLDYEKLYHYRKEKDNFNLEETCVMETSGDYYVGGFYLK